jgi:nitroimidazol reductase NimA-like FMN-containing flavoprotein (pyridoxamine 5'-phosphate oxidase superfamily)
MATVKKTIPDKISKGSIPALKRLAILDKTQWHAVLATASGNIPYTSLVAFALTSDGKSLLFATPKISTKYKNILKNKKVSLLIDSRSNLKKDYLGAESITIVGTAETVKKNAAAKVFAEVLAKKHPGLSDFIKSPKTALVLVKITACLHVSKFQQVSVWKAT